MNTRMLSSLFAATVKSRHRMDVEEVARATAKLQKLDPGKEAQLMSGYLKTAEVPDIPDEPPPQFTRIEDEVLKRELAIANRDKPSQPSYPPLHHPKTLYGNTKLQSTVMVTCPYNSGHRMPEASLRNHLRTCPDRLGQEEVLQQTQESQPPAPPLPPPPPLPPADPDSEVKLTVDNAEA